LREQKVGLAMLRAGAGIGATAIEFPVPQREDDDVRQPDLDRAHQQMSTGRFAAVEQVVDEQDERGDVSDVDDDDQRYRGDLEPMCLSGDPPRCCDG